MSFLSRFHDSPLGRSTTGSAEGDSVARNVAHILHGKRDYASFLADFGLGETFHRPVTPATLETLRQEILVQVRLYEPRLSDPEAVMMPVLANGTIEVRLRGLLPGRRPLGLVIQLSPSQSTVALFEPGDDR